jgi:hypothetical protein
MNRSVELLDHRRLVEQLRGLERRTKAGGRDFVGHGPFAGAHDDLAVAVAGAVLRANDQKPIFSPEFLARMMFPEPKPSREERFRVYESNWLRGITQAEWRDEDDLEG